jgi:hypothetical protein
VEDAARRSQKRSRFDINVDSCRIHTATVSAGAPWLPSAGDLAVGTDSSAKLHFLLRDMPPATQIMHEPYTSTRA